MSDTKRRVFTWLLLGALAAVQTGCTYVNAKPQEKPELLKPVKRQEDLYETKNGSIVKQVRGTGVFVPADTKFHQYPVGGRLSAIPIKLGDSVKKGDVLLELDPGDMKMKIVEQMLVLAKAEDQLEQAKLARDPEKLRLAGLNKEVEELKLRGLEANLARTKLTSEQAGVITFLDFMKPGDSVTAYKSVVGISDPNNLLFMYSVQSAGDLSSIENGMEAEVDYGGTIYKGKVIQTPRSAPYTDNVTQSQKNSRSILIGFDNPPPASFGTQAEMSIVTDRKDNVIVIPRVGLRSYQGRYFVHVKDGDTRKEVDVDRGLETATEAEIRKGLKPGQQVILNN
ncbi:MAG: family efflux transporter, subunit [Paenibacillus sp.]|uniref:efflux RND transporter periplasmic adaptor subunit n=1 Tax=Paenibacillus sp. GCM10012303 TaxID=3317340 RepID=UPI0029F1DB0B|nr:family efflux transporter, subunit [Paenibacillus sp.]